MEFIGFQLTVFLLIIFQLISLLDFYCLFEAVWAYELTPLNSLPEFSPVVIMNLEI